MVEGREDSFLLHVQNADLGVVLGGFTRVIGKRTFSPRVMGGVAVDSQAGHLFAT